MAREAIILEVPNDLKSWEKNNLRKISDALNAAATLDNKINTPKTGLITSSSMLKVSDTDKVSDFLDQKLIAGTGITLTKSKTGGIGGEILTVDGHVPVTLATNHGLGLTGQALNMGTPSTCTAATTNAVNTTTHTHAITGFLTTLALDGLSDVDATSPTDDDVLMYDTATSTWVHQALPAAGGAEPALGNPAVNDYVLASQTDGTRSWVEMTGGSTTIPLGYNFGVYVTYKDDNEIYVQPGNIDVNGTDVSITTQTAHTMTSMVNATADFHYIYLAAAGTITDSATEPAWSDAKFGWYNGDTRCIGVVWVPSATPAILVPFVSNILGEYAYNDYIKDLVSSGNPTGDWIDITTASDYLPINSISAKTFGYNTDAGSYVSVYISAYESKSFYTGMGGNGYYYCSIHGWVILGASRDLAWWGDDDDDNNFIVRVAGYKIRV